MMRKIVLFAAVAMISLVWSIPEAAFAADKEKVKVSELLEDVNKIMSDAQDVYVNGDGDKAVALYRKALGEIKKIEGQYPDRVTSSEFAPLRFRRALCETEIDRILLEQVSVASRTVAVTDTRDLERKRLERKREAETNRMAKVSEKLVAKTGSGVVESVKVPPPDQSVTKKDDLNKDADKVPADAVNVAVELDWAEDMLAAEKYDEVERALVKVLRIEPANFKARFLMALVRIRQEKYTDAQIVMEDLLADYGRNEGVLLLAAGMYAAMQQYAKAMTMLDKALKIAPGRSEGYLNMAWLLLEMNPKELNDPEMYYRRSVELGGARDAELEKRLGIRQE